MLMRCRRFGGGGARYGAGGAGCLVTQALSGRAKRLAGTAGARRLAARRPPGHPHGMARCATSQDTGCQQIPSVVISAAHMSKPTAPRAGGEWPLGRWLWGRAPSFRRDGGTPDGEARRCRTARMGGRRRPKSPREVNPNQRRRGGPRALALGPGWAPFFPPRRWVAQWRGPAVPNGPHRWATSAQDAGHRPRETSPNRRQREVAAQVLALGPGRAPLPATTAGRPTARPAGAEPPA